jgi:hypothetical protein
MKRTEFLDFVHFLSWLILIFYRPSQM